MGRRSEHKPEELSHMALNAARNIVAREGLAGLSIRKIAKDIGYTSGTLYQHYRNIDDLIEQMNAATIDALRARCEQAVMSSNPAAKLKALADIYASFTQENKNMWAAIFDHRLPRGFERSDRYEKSVRQLLAVVEKAISPYYVDGEEEARLHDARVLWTWLYGASSLMTASRISKDESFGSMIDTVVDMYVRSRGKH